MIKIRIRNDDHEIDLQFPISENKLYAKLAEIHAIEGKDAPQSAFVTEVYARTGLYYPYNVAVTAGKEYSGHAHSFEGVIQALLDDPAGFSIAGFEEFYSKQEQEMLLDIRNKLMNNIGEKASTAAKPDSSELL